MVFVCHSCHNTTEPENAGITILKKYVLNPALITELEFLLAQPVSKPEKLGKIHVPNSNNIIIPQITKYNLKTEDLKNKGLKAKQSKNRDTKNRDIKIRESE